MFSILIYSYCMLKFSLDCKLCWKIHVCIHGGNSTTEKRFLFEVFVRFFQFSLKVGRLLKALWKNSLNDNLSVGIGFTAWPQYLAVCSVGPLKICKICKRMKKDMLHNVQISLFGDCNTAAVRGVCPGGEIVHPKQWAAVGGRSNNAHLQWDHDWYWYAYHGRDGLDHLLCPRIDFGDPHPS